ncbi:MAG: hypothetical protein JW829_09135 [Pirellulales bacterium]|nr:hypothetical protein [Pirellulales bacterium]
MNPHEQLSIPADGRDGKSCFDIQWRPIQLVDSQAKLEKVSTENTDLCIVYAAGHCTQWPLKIPMVMFVRHHSGPFYLGFEIAHWRFLPTIHTMAYFSLHIAKRHAA